MLVLSRKESQQIRLGDSIVLTIVRLSGDRVRLGIEAPSEVPVHRQEVYDMIQRNKQASLNAGTEVVPKSPIAQVTPITDKANPPPLPISRGNHGQGSGTSPVK